MSDEYGLRRRRELDAYHGEISSSRADGAVRPPDYREHAERISAVTRIVNAKIGTDSALRYAEIAAQHLPIETRTLVRALFPDRPVPNNLQVQCSTCRVKFPCPTAELAAIIDDLVY